MKDRVRRTCQMDNGLLFEAYGTIWKNTKGGSKEGNKEDIGRCSWLAQAEGGWKGRGKGNGLGEGQGYRRLVCVKERNKCLAFSILEKCCLFTNKNGIFSMFSSKRFKRLPKFSHRCAIH